MDDKPILKTYHTSFEPLWWDGEGGRISGKRRKRKEVGDPRELTCILGRPLSGLCSLDVWLIIEASFADRGVVREKGKIHGATKGKKKTSKRASGAGIPPGS